MELWSDNQGPCHSYSRFGTIPRRRSSQNYDSAHSPLHYKDQQDPSRESGYWTMPGSRTAGALHEYINWKNPELTSSSHFPFIPDRREDHHHLPPAGYQQWEAQGREWPTSLRAVRDYERGFLSEGWQRRWEQSGSPCYNREVSAKKRDSSYRELEAWAARYSHSLPRKRQMEELRGASKGPVESSRSLERDGRDPRVQHVSGLWDRQGRLTTKYNPYQHSGSDTTHAVDTKENVCFQRKMFSQPPGYIAPPPYNNPQKSSALVYQKATIWEQGDKSHALWTQPTFTNQDVSVNLENKKERDKEEVTKPEAGETVIELKQQKLDESSLKAVSSTDAKHTNTHSPKMSQELTSKVIEGRTFRLNRKTGRMTIFCLVSRIADATETPSLPLRVSHKNEQSTEKESVSESLRDMPEVDQTPKMSDEVDFRARTLMEQSDATQMETFIPAEKDTAEADDDASTFGNHAGRSAQPVAVKYPLWREPSFTNRTEAEGSAVCSPTASKEEKPDLKQRDAAKVSDEETDAEQKHKDTEGLLVIDTTCVVVKVQMIPSLKKEHVHYLDAAGNPPITADSEDVTEQNTEGIPLKTSHLCKADPTSVLLEEEHKDQSQKPFSCRKPSASPERQTLDEKTENTIRSPLPVCITEQQQEDGSNVEKRAAPFLSKQASEETTAEQFSEDVRVEQPQEKKIMKQSVEDAKERQPAEEGTAEEPANELTPEKPSDKTQTQTEEEEEFPDDPGDGVVSEVHLEEGPSLKTQDVSVTDPKEDEDPEDLVACQQRAADGSEEIDSHLETDGESLAEPAMSEDVQLETTSEECIHEQTQNETESSQLSDLHQFSSSSTTDSEVSVWKNSASELTAIPRPVIPPPAPSCDFSTSSTLQEDHLPSPSPPLSVTADAGVSAEDDDGVDKISEEEGNRESLGADTSEAEPWNLVGAAALTDNQKTNQAFEKTDKFETCNADASILLQPPESDPTELDASVKPSSLIHEKLTEDPAEQICNSDEGLWLQKVDVLRDDLKSGSSTLFDEFPSSELPSSPCEPCESEAEVIPPLDEDLVQLSHPSHKEARAEEDLQLSSSSLFCSPHLLPPSSAPLKNGSPSADEKEPEYPESLWDVVNRIRKHTAPDSENEEEDASELWDLENNVSPVSSEIFSAQQEVSHGEVKQENMENVDEDVLSSCSTSSNVSDHTVIAAEEEKTAEQ